VRKAKPPAALNSALGFALLRLIAAQEEDALGPASEDKVRHGRIALSALTKADSDQTPEARERRRPARRAACGC
jgi:hypothetical protein